MAKEKIERITFNGVTSFYQGGTEFFSLTETLDPQGSGARLEAAGELRSGVRYDLRDELMLCAAMGKDIELNMAKLTRISNSNMTVLLEIQQTIDQIHRGSLTLRALPKEIYNALDRIGLTDLLMIED